METRVTDIIREVREKGFRLALDGSGLSFSYPKDAPPKIVAELREKLKHHKDQLVVSLSRQFQTTKGRTVRPVADIGKAFVPPIIWEAGNINQIRSLLVLREAELVVAKVHVTGNDRIDWHVNNRILDLEIKIADLRGWLAEAEKAQQDAKGEW